MLATLLRPTSGTATVLGYDLTKEYLDVRRKIGYMPDFFNLYNDLTLQECLNFFAKVYGVEKAEIPDKIDAALNSVDLQEKRHDFIRHLSRGMVQRIGLACLLVRDAQLLLLDEPASGLDPFARIGLKNVLRNLGAQGKTIIISSHILTELSGFCTHIAIMERGKIVLHGSVEELNQKVHKKRKVTVSFLDSSQKPASILLNLKSVENMLVEKDSIHFETQADLKELASVNKILVDNGIEVTGFHQNKCDLEQLFMSITSQKETK
ncbi:MAG: hypothetical protein A2Y07_11380 [Planctomycetes bacterium GWF2_50_10]|nr:MAG: hypothetical protein A2Y07_11380 [Planctomycetes bacterium GWF2_50_10]